MDTFKEWFATSIIASWLRAFAAIVLAMFIADGADVFAVDATDIRTWTAAGLAAVLPLAVRWLNDSDVEFGRGSVGSSDRFDVFGDDEE